MHPEKEHLFIDPCDDVILQTGVFLIKNLLSESLTTSKKDIINRANFVRYWLNSKATELTDDEILKVRNAWKTYFAHCNAPSQELVQTFETLHCQYAEWGHVHKLDSIPQELISIFNNFFSLSNNISQQDTFSFSSNNEENDKKRIGFRKKNLSKRKRKFIIFSLVWILYVSLRTIGNFKIFGVFFYHWDSDMYIANCLVPPCCVAGWHFARRWINNGTNQL
ncbi:hypothetical protein [Desulfovibrio sp. X2]|uniref:hypothetical protein n=1 Tax=Desulfovibrio sp. X2 TaxID=941449 RepID=UPI001269705B|nr:hypothetical protein [Desulfovibrio sp. X2]